MTGMPGLPTLRVALAVSLIAASASGQTQPDRTAFEEATVKPTGPGGTPAIAGVRVRGGCVGGPGTRDPSLFHCGEVTVVALIGWGYRPQRYEIEYPKGLDDIQFEVVAKVPEGARKEQMPLMVQTLLVERFRLKFHTEQKQVAGCELTVAKDGPKMPKTGDVEPEGGPPPSFSRMTPEGWYQTSAPKQSLGGFAKFLASRIGRPVKDATGLTGVYDFALTYALPTPTAIEPPEGPGPTIFEAVQKLGLKLVSARVSATMFVVDRAEKMPTEN